MNSLLKKGMARHTNKDMHNIYGYSNVRQNREHAKCGGVGMFIRDDLKFKICRKRI